MDIKDIKNSGRSIVIFAAQVIVLIICVWYIEFIYYANIYPDKLVKETFEQTTCTILNKTLTTRGKILHRYRADFAVSYVAQGVAYQQSASANGLDRSMTTDRESQEAQLGLFDIGETYPCWYSPDVPTLVVLVLRHNWSSTFPLFIPSVIALIMIYYIGRAMFLFLGTATIKTREKVKKHRDKNHPPKV